LYNNFRKKHKNESFLEILFILLFYSKPKMAEQIVNALPNPIQKEIYDMVYESKILYKEFQQLLNNSNSENYQELSGILKKVLKNEILVRFLTKNKTFKRLYDSYFTEQDICVKKDELYDLFTLSLLVQKEKLYQ